MDQSFEVDAEEEGCIVVSVEEVGTVVAGVEDC